MADGRIWFKVTLTDAAVDADVRQALRRAGADTVRQVAGHTIYVTTTDPDGFKAAFQPARRATVESFQLIEPKDVPPEVPAEPVPLTPQPFPIDKWLGAQLDRALDLWMPAQILDPSRAFYLYGRRGGIAIAEERPAGFELLSPERVSPAWTRDQARTRLFAVLRSSPILPPEQGLVFNYNARLPPDFANKRLVVVEDDKGFPMAKLVEGGGPIGGPSEVVAAVYGPDGPGSFAPDLLPDRVSRVQDVDAYGVLNDTIKAHLLRWGRGDFAGWRGPAPSAAPAPAAPVTEGFTQETAREADRSFASLRGALRGVMVYSPATFRPVPLVGRKDGQDYLLETQGGKRHVRAYPHDSVQRLLDLTTVARRLRIVEGEYKDRLATIVSTRNAAGQGLLTRVKLLDPGEMEPAEVEVPERFISFITEGRAPITLSSGRTVRFERQPNGSQTVVPTTGSYALTEAESKELDQRLAQAAVPAALKGKPDAVLVYPHLAEIVPGLAQEERIDLALEIAMAMDKHAPADWRGDELRERQVKNALFAVLFKDRAATQAVFDLLKRTLPLRAIVRFRQPATPEEAAERFRVVELRGPRVLVEGVSTAAGDFSAWALKPTFVYLASDLEVAPPDVQGLLQGALNSHGRVPQPATTGQAQAAADEDEEDEGPPVVMTLPAAIWDKMSEKNRERVTHGPWAGHSWNPPLAWRRIGGVAGGDALMVAEGGESQAQLIKKMVAGQGGGLLIFPRTTAPAWLRGPGPAAPAQTAVVRAGAHTPRLLQGTVLQVERLGGRWWTEMKKGVRLVVKRDEDPQHLVLLAPRSAMDDGWPMELDAAADLDKPFRLVDRTNRARSLLVTIAKSAPPEVLKRATAVDPIRAAAQNDLQEIEAQLRALPESPARTLLLFLLTSQRDRLIEKMEGALRKALAPDAAASPPAAKQGMDLSQGTYLRPKTTFQFIDPRAKRRSRITFRDDQVFWITSSATEAGKGVVEIARRGQHKGGGYDFTVEQVAQLFVPLAPAPAQEPKVEPLASTRPAGNTGVRLTGAGWPALPGWGSPPAQEPTVPPTPPPPSSNVRAEYLEAAEDYQYLASLAGLGTRYGDALRQVQRTTQNDLDAWLQRRFGIDAATARRVSNQSPALRRFESPSRKPSTHLKWLGPRPAPTFDDYPELRAAWADLGTDPVRAPAAPDGPPPDALDAAKATAQIEELAKKHSRPLISIDYRGRATVTDFGGVMQAVAGGGLVPRDAPAVDLGSLEAAEEAMASLGYAKNQGGFWEKTPPAPPPAGRIETLREFSDGSERRYIKENPQARHGVLEVAPGQWAPVDETLGSAPHPTASWYEIYDSPEEALAAARTYEEKPRHYPSKPLTQMFLPHLLGPGALTKAQRQALGAVSHAYSVSIGWFLNGAREPIPRDAKATLERAKQQARQLGVPETEIQGAIEEINDARAEARAYKRNKDW